MKNFAKLLFAIFSGIALMAAAPLSHAADYVSAEIQKEPNFLGGENEKGLILLLIDKLHWSPERREWFINHMAEQSQAYLRATDQFARQDAKEEFKRSGAASLKEQASKISDWVIDGDALRKYDFEQKGYWVDLPEYYKPSGEMENAIKFPSDLKVLVRVPQELAKEKSRTRAWNQARFRVTGDVGQMEANPDAALPTRTCYVFFHFSPKMVQIVLGDGTILSQSTIR